ncbi:hypothetical protein [Kitasatospora cinereorecta]|uniref:DUF1877 family protein n=1 Tax=Kitasatospora cinereorecta TaxID=285560 RepID=A0ABW0VJS2_9ACTN
MGIYLVSVEAEEWAEEEGFGALVGVLGEALAARGAGPLTPPEPRSAAAYVRGDGSMFEEKLYRPMDGFAALCERVLAPAETEALLGWDVLLPLPLDGPFTVTGAGWDGEETTVHSAHRALAAARRLATAVALPPSVPAHCDNLQIGVWFDRVRESGTTRTGAWTEDLDAAFYTAVYLRAAEHALRRGCPLVYS